MYTNSLDTWKALQYNSGKAVEQILKCPLRLLAETYVFVVHAFVPRDRSCRRLGNELLLEARKDNGFMQPISKAWLSYSMWFVQLENRADAFKLVKTQNIVLDRGVWKVTPFDIRSLPVCCFACYGPHMRKECPTPGHFRCGVCSTEFSVEGQHNTRTCQLAPRCVHCGEGHVAWLCRSDNVPSDVKLMREKVAAYRGRKPNWYVAYCDSIDLASLSSASARRPGRKTKSKQPAKDESKTTQLTVDFMFKHQPRPAPVGPTEQASTPAIAPGGSPSRPRGPEKRPFSAVDPDMANDSAREETQPLTKRRGLPKASGSADDEIARPEIVELAPKRPRGRPKGSKNVKRQPSVVPAASPAASVPSLAAAAADATLPDAASPSVASDPDKPSHSGQPPLRDEASMASILTNVSLSNNVFGLDFTRYYKK